MGSSAARPLAGLLLVAQAATLVVEPVAIAASRAPYDPLTQTISDLGSTSCTTIDYPAGPVAVCSPLHGVVNAIWIMAGLCLVAAALALPLVPAATRRRTAVWAAVLIGVMGASTIACGLVPLDVDLVLHSLVSLPGILVGPAAAALAMRAWGGRSWSRAAWAVAVIAGLAALLVLFTLGAFGLMGLLERIAVWVPLIGLGVLGLLLLRRPSTDLSAPGARSSR